jgi:hypothetical protein
MLKYSKSVVMLILSMFALLSLIAINRDQLDLSPISLLSESIDMDDENQLLPAVLGIKSAYSDIAKGEIRYFFYGLRSDNPQERLQQSFPDVPITAVLSGCVIGNSKYVRNNAYNQVINKWLKEHYGNPVEVSDSI